MSKEWVRQPNWPPAFYTVDTADEAADHINRPHEDYPQRVDKTRQLLGLYECLEEPTITKEDVQGIQEVVMYDLEPELRGQWRPYNVTVGPYSPPHFLQVRELMLGILPVTFANRAQLEAWYLQFNAIHPFADGNGRTSGIIISAMHRCLQLPGWLVSGM